MLTYKRKRWLSRCRVLSKAIASIRRSESRLNEVEMLWWLRLSRVYTGGKINTSLPDQIARQRRNWAMIAMCGIMRRDKSCTESVQQSWWSQRVGRVIIAWSAIVRKQESRGGDAQKNVTSLRPTTKIHHKQRYHLRDNSTRLYCRHWPYNLHFENSVLLLRAEPLHRA